MTEKELVKKLQESGFEEHGWFAGDRLFRRGQIFVRLDHYETVPSEVAIIVNGIAFHVRLDAVTELFNLED